MLHDIYENNLFSNPQVPQTILIKARGFLLMLIVYNVEDKPFVQFQVYDFPYPIMFAVVLFSNHILFLQNKTPKEIFGYI